MYFSWLLEVMKRAFSPMPRVTDVLQILAASALPATSRFFGIQLPQNAGEATLAYIGLATLSFVAIRFFWAPYAIWKEQTVESVALKLELSRPERKVIEALAKHRAKARSKLVVALQEFFRLRHADGWEGRAEDEGAVKMDKIRKLQAEGGLSDAFNEGRHRFLKYVILEARANNDDFPNFTEAYITLKLLQRHAMGEITAEDLLLQLPPDIVLKKLQ
ncbi:hypothetical protein [Novosphingobium sp.]|uniref:hypothetical protein n=1 Tax=Novosphingobium sp. TaxID=1874826 RepID=UPI00286A48A9|nr:hypothetical protein [Novosphingobium sp.]